MKNITLIILVIISLSASAQNQPKYFFCTDSSQVKGLADSIAANFRDTLVYNDFFIDKSFENFNFTYTFKNKYSKIGIIYKTRFIGRNLDLEIKGTAEYYLYFVAGKFLDIFPIWQELNPTANKSAITGYKNGDEARFIFNKVHFLYNLRKNNSNDQWEIQCYEFKPGGF